MCKIKPRFNSRSGGSDVGQLPLEIYPQLAGCGINTKVQVSRTLLELLKALKGDFKLVLVGELGGVVHDIDPQKRDHGHGGGCGEEMIGFGEKSLRRQSNGNRSATLTEIDDSESGAKRLATMEFTSSVGRDCGARRVGVRQRMDACAREKMQGGGCKLGEEAGAAALKEEEEGDEEEREEKEAESGTELLLHQIARRKEGWRETKTSRCKRGKLGLAHGPCAVGRTTDAISGRTALMGSSQRPGG